MDDLDCPCCAGSGYIAPNGEGLYVFLAAVPARIDRLQRGIARAIELRAIYLHESGEAADHRVRLCDEEVAGWSRMVASLTKAANALREPNAAATCIQCRGEGGLSIDTSFAPQTSDDMMAALSRAVA